MTAKYSHIKYVLTIKKHVYKDRRYRAESMVREMHAFAAHADTLKSVELSLKLNMEIYNMLLYNKRAVVDAMIRAVRKEFFSEHKNTLRYKTIFGITLINGDTIEIKVKRNTLSEYDSLVTKYSKLLKC